MESTGWANSTGTGATTSTYTPSSATPGTTFYRVLINASNSGCGQAVSNNAIAVISADIIITTQPSNVNECVGGNEHDVSDRSPVDPEQLPINGKRVQMEQQVGPMQQDQDPLQQHLHHQV
jgi:hypothetical protein